MRIKIILSFTFLFCNSIYAQDYTGVASHDQNPLLAPYWIPHTIGSNDKVEWQLSNSLFISNTSQKEILDDEILIIDGEFYQINFDFQLESNNWIFNAQIPLISSQGGFLDTPIYNWHDALSLPQGNRGNKSHNKINQFYSKNGTTYINNKSSISAIGDISLALMHQWKLTKSTVGLGVGSNFSINNATEIINNSKPDYALWVSYFSHNNSTAPLFITLGLTFPGQSSSFNKILNREVYYAQAGALIKYSEAYDFLFQFDYHQSFLTHTQTKGLGDSLQWQLGMRLKKLIDNGQVDLFFSEDIFVSSAPDITFGLIFTYKL